MKIDRSHDVPYLAGTNTRGTKVYIDRHLPKRVAGRSVDRFLKIHEETEFTHMKQGLTYGKAHKIAEKAEMAAVRKAGLNPKMYSIFMSSHVKTASHEGLQKVPKDLYLKPYTDSHDRRTIRRLSSSDKARIRRRKA